MDKPAVDQADMMASYLIISSRWNDAEQMLAFVLAALLKTKIQLCVALLATLTSNKAKRDMIVNVAKTGLASGAVFKKVEKLMKRVSHAARARNELIHGRLLNHPEHSHKGLTILHTPQNGEPAMVYYTVYTPARLKQITQQIDALNKDLCALAQTLRRARRVSLRGTRM